MKLSHLDQIQRDELKMLILEYEHLFSDIPTRTDQIYHDVDIEGSKPIKQHPFRMNPTKLQYPRQKIRYLLDNDFIEPSQSDRSFLVFLCENQMEYFVCALTTKM